MKYTGIQQAQQPEPELSPITVAIHLTLRTIEARTKLYTGLVITVSLTSLAAMLLAALLRSWTPLSALLLLVPFAGGYLLLDNRRVTRWRTDVLDLWCHRDLRLEVFAKCISTYPSIPPRTLEAMLAGLPKSRKDSVANAGKAEEKHELIHLTAAAASREQRRTLLAVVSLSLAAGLLAAGIYTRSDSTLLAAALAALLAGVLKAYC